MERNHSALNRIRGELKLLRIAQKSVSAPTYRMQNIELFSYSRHKLGKDRILTQKSLKSRHSLHISKKSSNFADESCKAYGTVSFFEDIYTRGHSFRCE